MANLRIAQPLLLSGPIQNSFKRLKFWLKFLSDLAKGGVAPSLPGCATAYTMVPRAYERGVQGLHRTRARTQGPRRVQVCALSFGVAPSGVFFGLSFSEDLFFLLFT